MESAATIRPVNIHNSLYKFIGAVFLILNKLRHDFRGYTTPRTFPISDYEKATDYDLNVVENWLHYLSKYSNREFSIKNKSILELGPGADLGVGLYLLFKGVSQYNALDVNSLIESVPQDFYNYFFQRLEKLDSSPSVKLDFLLSQLQLTCKNNNDRLNYICSRDFNLNTFKRESIDIVLSQAAFEHFNNIEETVKQLSEITKRGAILISEIDLKTHSRWVRDRDPLNIYRYSDSFYNLCKFSGSPNRIRPYQYEKIFQKNGWKNIRTIPIKVLDEQYLTKVRSSLNKRFHNEKNQMDYLSVILCATKE